MSTELNLSLKNHSSPRELNHSNTPHWPPVSSVDKTSTAMDWEASFNDSLGPEHHLELSNRVCEAWPSLWTWPAVHVCGCGCVCEKESWRATVWGGGSRDGAPSTAVKTNDARTDGTQHRQHVQSGFQLQQTEARNGKCLHDMINDAVFPTKNYHQGMCRWSVWHNP